jgi:hypothetical protein
MAYRNLLMSSFARARTAALAASGVIALGSAGAAARREARLEAEGAADAGFAEPLAAASDVEVDSRSPLTAVAAALRAALSPAPAASAGAAAERAPPLLARLSASGGDPLDSIRRVLDDAFSEGSHHGGDPAPVLRAPPGPASPPGLGPVGGILLVNALVWGAWQAPHPTARA